MIFTLLVTNRSESTFKRELSEELQQIQDDKGKIIDIKFQTSPAKEKGNHYNYIDTTLYSALVIYSEEDE
jgi:hypothetical protein